MHSFIAFEASVQVSFSQNIIEKAFTSHICQKFAVLRYNFNFRYNAPVDRYKNYHFNTPLIIQIMFKNNQNLNFDLDSLISAPKYKHGMFPGTNFIEIFARLLTSIFFRIHVGAFNFLHA